MVEQWGGAQWNSKVGQWNSHGELCGGTVEH